MIYLGLISLTGIIIYFYWRTMPEISRGKRYFLAILRWIALAIVMILLFNPIIRYSRRNPVQMRQLLLLDNSISMNEQSDNVSKLQKYKVQADSIKLLLESKGYKCKLLEFADGINGDKESTRLTKTFSDLQEQDNYKNVKDLFMFSDGWFDDSDPEFIQNIQFPVHVIQSDFQSTSFDLQITKLKYNKRSWLKEITPFIVAVSSSHYQGGAELDFYISDEKIETKQINFKDEKYQQVLFEHEFSQTGLQPVRVEIHQDSLLEVGIENNSFPGAVLVLENKAAVKVISDELSWEGRYLVQAAERDERFEVTYLYKGSDLRKNRDVVSLGSELENCQVLCLINNGKLNFTKSQIELIDRYVANGGGLYYLGQPLAGLDRILPVRSTGIRRIFEGKFRLTQESAAYQSFQTIKKNLDEIPPVRFYYTELKTSGTLLAEFPAEQTPPALVFQEYGNGKVLYGSFLDLWKWQLWGEDDHYSDFNNNIMQWLSYAKANNFFAWSEQNSYLIGEDVNIELAAFDEKYAPLTNLQAEIVITKDDQEYLRDYLNLNNERYSFSFTAKDPAEYKFTITDKQSLKGTGGKFMIMSANSEVRDRGINKSLLQYIARQTVGKELFKVNDLADYPKAESRFDTTYFEIPLYKKWYIITLFLLSFCLEIFFRKRWGLL
ncbi:MAG: hypothetical protein RAO94_04195 [Candidatus Stygibacter australis]|nr:hypothetical protein [Candidatus Stygibacter australis]